MWISSCFKRIHPAQSPEAPHIGIRGMQFGLVLDCQRCQMRICSQIAGGARILKQLEKDFRMSVTGMDQD